MVSALRWKLSGATLLQLGAELSWLLVAAIVALVLNGSPPRPITSLLAPAVVFAGLMVFLNGAFGLYRRDRKLPFVTYVSRLFLAMLIGAPSAYLVAAILPGGDEFQHTIREAVVLAFGGLVLVRQVVVWHLIPNLLPHRVLVLGTGPEARVVEASLAAAESPGLQLVGFCKLETAQESLVSPRYIISSAGPLEETVRNLQINEIIVAVREQRGGVLPMRALLECRLAGVQVTDLARFFERVHGQIPVDLLKASWLIYGNGFRQDSLRSTVKRVFDITVGTGLLILTLPIIVVVLLVIALESGAPVIYRQERVGLRGRTFNLLKFRSMRHDAERDGEALWATDGDSRVTPFGRFLRRSRMDELPQLINVLKGEMSFVGPRPERPKFVSLLTEQVPFYAVRQSVKPGITGWAQVRYSYGASVEQSVRKLEYDLYYVKNHTLFLDLLILLETVRVVLLGEGAR